jgi:hypothetical protein
MLAERVHPEIELERAAQSGPQRHVHEQPDVAMGRTLELTLGKGVELIRSPGRSQGARVVTVHAGVTFNEQDIPTAGQRTLGLVGTLGWGQGGASFQAEFDFKSGVALTLVASFVDLRVAYEPAIGDPDGRFRKCLVSAALVWGTRPGRGLTTRTLRAVVPDGGAHTFAVPNWAFAVQFLTPATAWYSAPLAASAITFHGGPTPADDPSLVVAPADVGLAALTFDGVKLAESVRFVTVTNALGAPLPIRAVFPLEL